MEENEAIRGLSALAHETRLRVFRVLVVEGPGGLAAGAIAARLDVPPSTLSTHLGLMEGAGILRRSRVRRQIFYAADFEGIRRLLTFLTADCCQGRPELCRTLVELATAGSEPDRAEENR
ncbi:MAG: helix-turn-helix transcriptional regulator [Rhodospirillaceae bacterium]|nr:helix-turn-helix transcriptional regulator [Rhodospirillaceae bacterium]